MGSVKSQVLSIFKPNLELDLLVTYYVFECPIWVYNVQPNMRHSANKNYELTFLNLVSLVQQMNNQSSTRI